jgi:flagellar basal-body rod protein FlgB
MPISDIPILSMLRTRMEWHQQRQSVLAENVANADTPGYRARDLGPPNFERMVQSASVTLATTDPAHIAIGGSTQFSEGKDSHYEARPRGNTVSHEDEMLKLAGNQMDYDAAASVYSHSLAMIKAAFGKV